MDRYSACCGLYCGACSSMMLHESRQGEESAAHFSCDFEESACSGCGSGCVADCEFIRCCRDHGVESCGLCGEFPCAEILRFSANEWPHHAEVLANLGRIREVGIAAWLEEQKSLWRCPSCGGGTHWYQHTCTICGARWKPRYGDLPEQGG